MRGERDVILVPERSVNHNCALVGIVLESPNRAIHDRVATGVLALQHRGEEGAGLAWGLGSKVSRLRGLGLSSAVFLKEKIDVLPPTCVAIGHTRYSTAGGNKLENVQPFIFDGETPFAIAHNGNVAWTLRPGDGEPTSDTYGIGKMIAREEGSFEERVIKVLSALNGAYTLLFVTPNDLYVARDPWGFRPAVLGRLEGGELRGMVVASETVALQDMKAVYVSGVPRGLFLKITAGGMEEVWKDPRTVERAGCTFETAYFANSASRAPAYEIETNHFVRKALGATVARRARPSGDFIAPVPKSGFSYAEGVEEATGLPIKFVIQENPYRGRSFIKPRTIEERIRETLLKYRFIKEEIRGRRVVMVDDSVVRGPTSQGLAMALLSEMEAERVELLVGVPPIIAPCFWGIDFPEPRQLVYHQLMPGGGNVEEFEKKLAEWLVGGDPHLTPRVRVVFQRLEDYVSITRRVPFGTPIGESGGCFHCVSGIIPKGATVDLSMTKHRFERAKQST